MSVRRFRKDCNGQELNKAYFYRFLAALIYVGLHAPHKSIDSLLSHDPSEHLQYLHKTICRNTFKNIKAVLHFQTDRNEEEKQDSADSPLLKKIGIILEMFLGLG